MLTYSALVVVLPDARFRSCDDFFLASDAKKRTQKALQAIENFIVQVNSIHLSQFQQSADAENKEEGEGRGN